MLVFSINFPWAAFYGSFDSMKESWIGPDFRFTMMEGKVKFRE